MLIKKHMEAIDKFIQIDKKTNISNHKILREPNNLERDELWEIVRDLVEFIYQQDLVLTKKDLRDKACHYAIVALHWCDLRMEHPKFSYSNGRFRRDTIALAVCLFSRMDNGYREYYKILKGWILPHANWSITLWSLRSIHESNYDNFFGEYERENVNESIQYMTESFVNKGYVDFAELYDRNKNHPLIHYWWRVRNLLKYPSKETWVFLRKYIWNSIDLPGGLGLLSRDRNVNKEFLKNKVESFLFPDDWKFKEKLMFLFLFFCSKTDGELDAREIVVMKEKWGEWLDEFDEDIYIATLKHTLEELNRNSSLERLYQCAHDLKEHIIRLNTKDDGSIDDEKVNKQLAFILKDLRWLSFSDGNSDKEEFQFIEALRGIWGVEEKIFPPKDYDTTFNSGLNSKRNVNFPELKELQLVLTERQNSIHLDEVNIFLNHYHQTEIKHWGPFLNRQKETINAQEGTMPLVILSYPRYSQKTKDHKDDLFRKFTVIEVDQIIKKIEETKSCIYLTWINNTLKKSLDLRGFKSPFWFMPFVCYGFDMASFLIFEQNGIYTNYKNDSELSCVLHVDLWEEVSVEPGWNGLLNPWIEQNYYQEEDLIKDRDNITSMRISGTNPRNNQKVQINIVDTHGPGNKSSLYIIQAIWTHAWKRTVEENKDSSIYILPSNNEYFDSWDGLLSWAQSNSFSTPGNQENI